MRLIALLRDPAERAYSEFFKKLRWHSGTDPLEQVDKEPESVALEFRRMQDDPDYYSVHYRRYGHLAKSLYAEHLERWLERFPREQLLVLTSEELADDPARVVTEALAFLGLPPVEGDDAYPRKNKGKRDSLPPDLRARLTEYFDEPNRRLYALLGRDFGWARPTL